MSALKKISLLSFQWILAFAYGWMVVGYVLWLWIRGSLRHGIARDVPPDCLNDPNLGRHKYVKIENMKLHYVESGNHEKPLVILIHGSPDFWFTWRKQITFLNQDYWVVAVDLRGCGDSEGPYFRSHYTTAELANDIAQFICLLNAPSAHLICAGTGGQIGWYMAYNYPQLISKLVLIHSPHPFVIRQQLSNNWSHYYKAGYLYLLKLPALPEVAATLNDFGLIDKIMKPLLKMKTIEPQEIEAYKFVFSSRDTWTGPLHILRALDLSPIDEEEPEPDVITKPTLLIMGDADPLLPMETAYRSAEYVERITVRPAPGPGYMAHVSRAQQVNENIIKFLKEMPWKPLTPLEPTTNSSLVGRVMGASLSAVTNTVSKTSGALEMTRAFPGGLVGIAQASFRAAESKLGLD
ncbi:epoxide hydrolase 4-like isoform X2 [Palaemon carinicauda]|uniref:epoxide hydrolase 4-like isoform X2 n=1 Tax=Palaemon carinicauda TaxID=392227 RepID=UPI0035B62C8E